MVRKKVHLKILTQNLSKKRQIYVVRYHTIEIVQKGTFSKDPKKADVTLSFLKNNLLLAKN